MTLRLLSALVLLAVAAVPARAQVTVTHVYDFHKYETFNHAPVFPGVDPSLGTLVDVAVETWYRVDVTFRVENRNDFAIADPWAGAYGALSGFGPDNADWQFVFDYSTNGPSPARPLGAFDGNEDFGGSSGYTYAATTGTVQVSTIHPHLSLYDWLNSSEVPFHLSLNFLHNIVGAGDMAYDYDIEVTGQQSISYTYIPEPATYAALFGFGALGIAILHRQRRRRR